VTTPDVAYRVLIVDDDAKMTEDLQELLADELTDLGGIEFEVEQDFARAEERLNHEDFDLVILDVRDAADGSPSADIEGRGRELYKKIASVRWVPVVFFTGVPQQVRALEEPPLIRVVTKNALDDIAPAVREGLLSGVPALTRRISGLVERQVRDFMRDVVAPHWNEMAAADPNEIAPVIVNRLAAWLRENGLRELDRVVDGDLVAITGRSAAARVYLMPPVTHHLTATDLLVDPQGGWWLVITPACDLYEDHPDAKVEKPRKAKVQYVHLAKADRVFTDDGDGSESPPITAWLSSAKSNKDKGPAQRAFRVDDNRYRALPRYLDVPDLVIDFENVRSVALDEARGWKRVATLDSPFSESMLIAYSRSVGRIGTPDLSFDDVQARLGLAKPKSEPVPIQPSSSPPNGAVLNP
jgi:CheY-like chemotaxis protein